MKKSFEFNESDQIIACVGNNGGTNNQDIMAGFRRSVQILLKSLEDGNEFEDMLVYPIVYNARHSIELGLKIFIENVWQIQQVKKVKTEEQIQDERKKLHTHNLKQLNDIANSIVGVDRRLPEKYKKIVPYLMEYYFDVEGDAFKYEANKENIPHMISNGISHIGLDTLGKNFEQVMELLDDLIYQSEKMIGEYKLGTYTKNLSRYDIERVSERLLPRNQWKNDEFKVVKNEIKQEYSIGSNELSNVLKIIEGHRKFCANIGLENKFGNITDIEMDMYSELVNKSLKYDNKDEGYIDFDWDSRAKLRREAERNRKIMDIAKGITKETIILLLAFQYIGSEGTPVEKLEELYNDFLENDYERGYMIKRIEKVVASYYILIGMKMCGQVSYFLKLKDRLEKNGILGEEYHGRL